MKEGDSTRPVRKKGSKSDTTMSKAERSQRENVPDCAVCLQTCVHPVQLPCSHVFCFLCMKGASTQYRRCALCRQEIPVDFFTSPKLLLEHDQGDDDDGGADTEEHYTWFYEGRNGWWQYDERTSTELEESYRANKRTFELLIAGYVYVIDLDSMLQYRRADPSRRRRMKRDLFSAPKKGIAGLKIKVKREEESGNREVVGAEEEKENAGAVGGVPSTPTDGKRSKPGKRSSDDKGNSQVKENVRSDNTGHDRTTTTSSASLADSATDESVYEIHLLSESSDRTNESPPSQRNTSSSPHGDDPPAYALPTRQRRRPTSESPSASSPGDPQAHSSNTSLDSGASPPVISSVPIHHQRTHSAPEVHPLARPRGAAPQPPPRSRSSNQSSTPSAARPESEDTADVQDLSETIRSELIINIGRSTGTRQRQTHHHVHEV